VEHFRRERVGKVRVSRGPTALGRVQFLEPCGEDFAQLPKKLQGLAQIGQFVHQINFGQEADALVAEFRGCAQPVAQGAMARRGRLIDAAARASSGERFPAAKQALAFQALQGRIDLAEFGRPEVVDALIEDGFQVVAAGGFAEQAK
jgi:hypothetical protein